MDELVLTYSLEQIKKKRKYGQGRVQVDATL